MQILIVEDDTSTRVLLEQMLLARGHTVVACDSAERASEQYRQSFFPLVVLDLYLPGMDGFGFCRWLRAEPDGERPYVLAGTASREPADLRGILEAGADDYLFKPYQPELFDVRLAVAEEALKVRAARRQLTDELRAERDHLAYLAAHDPLTNLHNKEHFTAAVESAVAAAGAGGPDGALFYVDLDHFKIVNDALGHAAGDRLLVQIAYLLRNALRPQDLAARFGGDKFVVLQPGLPLAEARLTAERVRTQIGNLRFCDSGRCFQLGASVGVALVNGETFAAHVLAAADSACFSAKARGRDRVEIFCEGDPELARLRDETARLADLRGALRTHGFTLRFQPVVDLDTRLVAFHEARTFLCAGDGDCRELDGYVAAAGRSHLVPEIDRASIRLAARALAAHPELRLAMSIAGFSLRDLGLPAFATRACVSAGRRAGPAHLRDDRGGVARRPGDGRPDAVPPARERFSHGSSGPGGGRRPVRLPAAVRLRLPQSGGRAGARGGGKPDQPGVRQGAERLRAAPGDPQRRRRRRERRRGQGRARVGRQPRPRPLFRRLAARAAVVRGSRQRLSPNRVDPISWVRLHRRRKDGEKYEGGAHLDKPCLWL